LTTNIDAWYSSTFGTLPQLNHNRTDSTYFDGSTNIEWGAGEVSLHPGGAGEFSILRFLAPSAGTYQLTVSFRGIDHQGATSDVHVLANNTSLFSAQLTGFHSPASFSTTLTLAQNDTIDFAVGYGSNVNYFQDSTGISAVMTIVPELQLTAAVSRKTHEGAGDFDISLLNANFGPECRSSGGAHTLVFAFSNNVVSGSASVATGTGDVSGTPTFAANTMTVNLTGVANAQTIAITLSNVTDSFAQVLPDTPVSMGVLLGDTTADRSVNSADIGQTKSQSGHLVTISNFREDVTVDGSINSADIGLVKSKSGTALPSPP
jgi:hypothetical protein